jgi:NAD(P)-dependent dehydrogenase (short-subunit alcohol dehydrogenase family)
MVVVLAVSQCAGKGYAPDRTMPGHDEELPPTVPRVQTPEEIGRVCLFLATADSAFVTGQAIPVEGGASLDY